MKDKRRTGVWVGALLIIIGGLITLYGFAVTDFGNMRIVDWYGLGFSTLRIGIAASLAGVVTALVATSAGIAKLPIKEAIHVMDKVPLLEKTPLMNELTTETTKEMKIEIPA